MKPYIFRAAEAGALICALAFSGLKARADMNRVYEEIARQTADYSARGGISKIGVMEFVASDGATGEEAGIASERIGTELVAAQGLPLAELWWFEGILEGVKNASLDAGRGDAAKALKDAFAVEAVVTGTVFGSGSKLKIIARLNDVKTGAVLFTAQAETKRDQPAVALPPGIELPGFPGPYPWRDAAAFRPADFRDSPSGSAAASCPDRKARLAKLNLELVDQKARYWAGKMNEPFFSVRASGRNPGVEITDPETREKFYELLAAYYNAANRAGLEPGELAEVTALLDTEKRFLTECGFR